MGPIFEVFHHSQSLIFKYLDTSYGKKNIHRDIIKTNKSMYIKTSYKPSTVHACNTMILKKKKERDTVIPSISVLLQSVQ